MLSGFALSWTHQRSGFGLRPVFASMIIPHTKALPNNSPPNLYGNIFPSMVLHIPKIYGYDNSPPLKSCSLLSMSAIKYFDPIIVSLKWGSSTQVMSATSQKSVPFLSKRRLHLPYPTHWGDPHSYICPQLALNTTFTQWIRYNTLVCTTSILALLHQWNSTQLCM